MTARKGDAELVLLFNPEEKTFTIDGVSDNNSVFLKSLDYTEKELFGKELRQILPEMICGVLDDYLEVDDEGFSNIVSILRRTRNFSLLSKAGQAIPLIMRIQTDVSIDNHTRYRMVLRNDAQASNELLKALNVINEYETLDKNLGVSTKEFFCKKAQIVSDYIQRHGLQATLAIISVDKYDGILGLFGKETIDGLNYEVVARCKTSFRRADILGYFGEAIFAVVLLEADDDSSRIPLNRLRNQISTQPLFFGGNKNVKSTVSVVYTPINDNEDVIELIESCVERIKIVGDDTNQFIELKN